jgi:hypothetical protein
VLGGGSTVPVRQVPGVHAQDDTAAKSSVQPLLCVTEDTLHHRRIEGTHQDEYIILVIYLLNSKE